MFQRRLVVHAVKMFLVFMRDDGVDTVAQA